MKKIILTIVSLSILVSANDKFLGTFTIDNYPIKKCQIIKVGDLISESSMGYKGQSKDLTKDGFISRIGDNDVRSRIKSSAVKDGYNAILGYKFYVNGAFDTFNMSEKNGLIGFATYRITGQGTPVKIKCNK